MIKVTGAGGFIGKAVLEYCNRQSLPAQGFTRAKAKANSNLSYVENYGDIPEGGFLIHLGEHNEISSVTQDIAEMHLETSIRLARKKFDKVVYVSSAAVYLPSDTPILPNSSGYSKSLYAVSKLNSENLFLAGKNVVARISNVFGPGMSSNNVISTVLAQKDAKIVKVYNTQPVRDYIWIDDVAAALVTLVMSSSSGIFHVSSGIGVSVKELIDTICSLAGNLDFIVEESMPGSKTTVVLDSSETLVRTTWHPKETLKSGLAKMVKNI